MIKTSAASLPDADRNREREREREREKMGIKITKKEGIESSVLSAAYVPD